MIRITLLLAVALWALAAQAQSYLCNVFDEDGNELCGAWLAGVLATPPRVVDALGNRYWAKAVATDSTHLPLLNHIPNQGGHPGTAYVIKTDAMDQLVYSTYLGSTDAMLSGFLVDAEGVATVAGKTKCRARDMNDAPECLFYKDGAYITPDEFIAGGGSPDELFDFAIENAYVAKIAAQGQHFVWGWHLGGHGHSEVTAVQPGPEGQVIATGTTAAPDFPVTRTVAACGNPAADPHGVQTPFTAIVNATGIVESWCGEPQAASLEAVGLYSPEAGEFYLKSDHTGGAADYRFRFGSTARAYRSITGDWNGNGQATVGLYDSEDGMFFLKNSHAPGGADTQFRFGPKQANWLPITGDWDGDGTVTAGLYAPDTSTFFLKNGHVAGSADVHLRFGPANAGWVPITGDWDGDGSDTIGLYDPVGGRFYLQNRLAGGPADVVFRFGVGNQGWLPLVGDWDDDGVDGIGVYAPLDSKFYLKNAHAGGAADVSFRYGPAQSGWVPVTGKWDNR